MPGRFISGGTRQKLAFVSGPEEIKSSPAKAGMGFLYFQTEPHSRTEKLSPAQSSNENSLNIFPTKQGKTTLRILRQVCLYYRGE